MNLKKEKLPLILLLILLVPTIKAFFTPGFYTSHDGETHTARIANYYLALNEGQIPPQLAPNLFGKLGFPIFIFIYPLPYLFGSFFHALGYPYTTSAEIVMSLGQVLSVLVFYLFLKNETRRTASSFIGALFFGWAPYRFLMLYVRGAYAESFSFLFVSLSFFSLERLIAQKNRKWIGFLALSLSGLLLSHQLTSIMFLPVIVWYFFTKLPSLKNKQLVFIKIVTATVLGFAIASFIYLPSFFERKYLRFDDLISYTHDHFVTIKQLIRSPWSYGFSHPGTLHDDMSFQIGLTHLAVVALAIAVFIKQLLRQKSIFKSKNDFKLLMWLAAFFFSVLLMIEHPFVHWLWKTLPGLNYLDFPWRFLGVTITTASLISAYLTKKTKSSILYLFLFIFVFIANRNHLRINQSIDFSDDHFENYTKTATWKNEFLPKTRITNRTQNIDGDFQVRSGDMEVIAKNTSTHHLIFDVNVNQSGELLIHRLDFPNWKLLLDGQPSEYSVTDASFQLKEGTDLSGLISVKLPQGYHQLELVFRNTPLRQAGIIMSLLGLASTLFLILLPEKNEKK